MKYVVVITARGGSKRLPRKNILNFMGVPLLAHSIQYAQSEIPEVPIFVSTDSEEIANISHFYGAQVIERPEILANDNAKSSDVIKHAANYLKKEGVPCDCIILLQPTNPLRPRGFLIDAMREFERVRPRSLVSYSPSHLKLLKKIGMEMIPVNYEFGQRSQDMELLYYENGLLYLISLESALLGEIQTPTSYPYIIDHPYAEVDIDTLQDFKLAEMYYKMYEE